MWFTEYKLKNHINKKFKKKKKKKRKKSDNFFFNFSKLPKKKGDVIYIVNALQVFLKRMKQKRPLEKKIIKKNQPIFFLVFQNCPLKGAQGDAVYILNALKVFLKRMKQQKRPLKNHPPNAGRGTLILFNSIDFGRLSF